MISDSSVARMLRRTAAVMAMAAVLIGLAAVPASADDEVAPLVSGSASSSYPNGVKLWSNIWLATWADSGGCADFTASAELKYGVSLVNGADWIKTQATFQAYGVGADVTALGKTGDKITLTWENNNGQPGSYLSGNLCTNVLTVGIGASNTASVFYNGTLKTVTASL